MRKILTNHTYRGVAYGNQKQMIPARWCHPLIGREPKTAGGESCQLRPPDEWIGVPVPAVISAERFAQALRPGASTAGAHSAVGDPQHAGRVRAAAAAELPALRLAHTVWNNGRYAYYRCRGVDVLANRGRRDPCHARQLPADRLDALVWADLGALLTEPAVLDDAIRRTEDGRLTGDERVARAQDLLRRRGQLQRQTQRLLDAYAAELRTLAELRGRRARLDDRLTALARGEQALTAAAVQDEHRQQLAARAEDSGPRSRRGWRRRRLRSAANWWTCASTGSSSMRQRSRSATSSSSAAPPAETGYCDHTIERLYKSVEASKRRSAVVGIFPNRAEVLRLLDMPLAEQSDEWRVGWHYFSEVSNSRWKV